MATTKGDVSFETSGQEGTKWSEKQSNFLVDNFCKRGVIFSSVYSDNGHHKLQPLFIWMKGLIKLNLTPGADKTNGQSVNLHTVAMKKRNP